MLNRTGCPRLIHSSLPPDDDVSDDVDYGAAAADDDDEDVVDDGVGDAGDTCVLASFATWLRLHYVALLCGSAAACCLLYSDSFALYLSISLSLSLLGALW